MSDLVSNNTSMVNITSTESGNNIVISTKDTQYYYLPFNKNPLDLTDPRIKDRFIKSIERRVRRSKLYKAYIDYLKSEKNLTNCAILGNIESEKGDKTKIEMHHGPIYTLYDYASIVLQKFMDEKLDLNTFDIAEEVLDLHRRNLVQVVMLSESVHKSMDNPEKAPFIFFEMTHGDLIQFVKEYNKYFSFKNRNDLKKYINDYKKKSKNKLNMFTPSVVKNDIIFTENKQET